MSNDDKMLLAIFVIAVMLTLALGAVGGLVADYIFSH